MAVSEVFRCNCHSMWNRRRLAKTMLCPTISDIWLITVTLLVIIQGITVDGLVIEKMDVPHPIINGSSPAIILDCDYQYDHNESKNLVIQWYYNHSSTPIYQWIPPRNPEALGEFQHRLDLNHRVSEDPYTKHRALRLLWPTVELAGNYKCLVSSFHSEDSKNQDLIVYVPADRLEINVTKHNDGRVNVSCVSEGGYPDPLISLLIYKNDEDRAEPVDNFRVTTRDGDADGHTDVIGYKEFEDRHLGAKKVVFECVLAIADADYKETEQYIYYPDIQHVKDGTSGLASSRLLTVTTAIVSTAAIMLSSTTFMFLRYNRFRC